MARDAITQRRIRPLLLALAGILAVVTPMVTSAQDANAAPTRHIAVNVSTTANAVGAEFARCHISTDGGHCTVQSGESATRTVGLTLGATRSEITGSLHISSARGVTVTVSCTSPALRAGQSWKARAMGTRYTYGVARQEAYRPRIGPSSWRTIATSSNRVSALDPAPSRISCGL